MNEYRNKYENEYGQGIQMIENMEKKVLTTVELKAKYAGEGKKFYAIKHSIDIDDDLSEEFEFLFRKPAPATYDRYIKTMSKSASKAAQAFVLDNVVDEQSARMEEALKEYPAMAITYAEKLLGLLGLGNMTSVKKL